MASVPDVIFECSVGAGLHCCVGHHCVTVLHHPQGSFSSGACCHQPLRNCAAQLLWQRGPNVHTRSVRSVLYSRGWGFALRFVFRLPPQSQKSYGSILSYPLTSTVPASLGTNCWLLLFFAYLRSENVLLCCGVLAPMPILCLYRCGPYSYGLCRVMVPIGIVRWRPV